LELFVEELATKINTGELRPKGKKISDNIV